MLLDVLSALGDTNQLGGILAVTDCPVARRHLRRVGARLLDDPDEAGLNAAVAQAAYVLEKQGVEGFLTIPGDTPAVTAVEIDRVASLINESRGLALVPARDGRGTNCLAMSLPSMVPPLFGPDSVEAHIAAARRQNIKVQLLSLPGFGFDVDTPDDLLRVNEFSQASKTNMYLDGIRLDGRRIGSETGIPSEIAVMR
jgi:2-phospho-L-lactate guanylyltransferase